MVLQTFYVYKVSEGENIYLYWRSGGLREPLQINEHLHARIHQRLQR